LIRAAHHHHPPINSVSSQHRKVPSACSRAAITRRKTMSKRYLPIKEICERYGVVDRTIERRMAAGILPQPIVINKRRYWDLEELEQIEREAMARRAAP
jgi:predicted DNA-binding transcriptional regulator AlpA